MSSTAAVIVDGLGYPEGLGWHGGRLWFSDKHTGTIHTWAPTEGVQVVACLCAAVSGLGWTPDGELLVVTTDDHCLVRVDANGDATLVADLSGCTSLPINNLVIDANGRAFVGASGFDRHSGVVVRVDLDGASSAVAEDLLLPNGMVFLDRGRTLVVAETLGARLTAFTVAAGGSLTNRRLWAQLPGDLLPERICCDADGAIWVASTTTTQCVRVVEGGDVVDWVRTGGAPAIACALGGPEGRTLLIATDGCVLAADVTIEAE